MLKWAAWILAISIVLISAGEVRAQSGASGAPNLDELERELEEKKAVVEENAARERAAAQEKARARQRAEQARQIEEARKEEARRAEEVRDRSAAARAAGLVEVPGGEFWMGCNESVDSECLPHEKPGRRVNVPAFWIDKTEVTVSAFRECANAGGCTAPESGGACNWEAGRESHPVNCVDWDQAQKYCAWRGRRLPTDAEWEKAARGTDGRKFPWGNGNASCSLAVTSDCGSEGTQPAGSKPAGASPYGALDMSGNVWEWTSDWYEVGKYRSLRGGAWGGAPRSARASDRSGDAPASRDRLDGFRCAQ